MYKLTKDDRVHSCTNKHCSYNIDDVSQLQNQFNSLDKDYWYWKCKLSKIQKSINDNKNTITTIYNISSLVGERNLIHCELYCLREYYKECICQYRAIKKLRNEASRIFTQKLNTIIEDKKYKIGKYHYTIKIYLGKAVTDLYEFNSNYESTGILSYIEEYLKDNPNLGLSYILKCTKNINLSYDIEVRDVNKDIDWKYLNIDL